MRNVGFMSRTWRKEQAETDKDQRRQERRSNEVGRSKENQEGRIREVGTTRERKRRANEGR
jgi:hypothetical protein